MPLQNGRKEIWTTDPKNSAVNTQTKLFHYYKRQPKVANKSSTIEVPTDLNKAGPESQSVTLDPAITWMSTSPSDSEKQRSVPNSVADGNTVQPSQIPACFQASPKGSLEMPVQPPDISNSLTETTYIRNNKRSGVVGVSSGPTSSQSHKSLYPIFNRRAAIVTPELYKETTPAPADATSSEPHESAGCRTKETCGVQIPEIIDLTTPIRERATLRDPTIVENCEVIIIDQGSQEKSINITSSPSQKNWSTKALHSYITGHGPIITRDQGLSHPSIPKSLLKAVKAPLPASDSQHIKGPQTSFRSPHPPLFRGREPSHAISDIQGRFPKMSDRSNKLFQNDWCSSDSVNRGTIMASLPSSHLKHPGIARFVNVVPNHESVNGELWTRKWRPRRAEEVLGNEAHALFLRAWLQALVVKLPSKPSQTKELGNIKGSRGVKRPKVIRSVAKESSRKKRRTDSDDEDWSFDEGSGDDEDSVDTTSGGLDRSLGCTTGIDGNLDMEVPQNVSETDTKIAKFTTLTNTILLEGPPGSGKTCTVYACAEELGWEVFEVYPGIGKRSGGSISSLIGDVGKNHIVGRRGTCALHTRDGNYDKHNTGHFGRHGEKSKDSGYRGDPATVQQSIILLEEVDILYKEDVNFWSAVINLIKTSHRPVIMTCNDATLVPQCDLPLQTCLHFKFCPAPLAVSFLQSACLAESHLVARNDLEILYGKTYNLICNDERDGPSLPFPSQARPCPDLRRTINELQFRSCVAEGGADVNIAYDDAVTDSCEERIVDWATGLSSVENAPVATHDIDQIWKHCEYSSFLGAHLERGSSDALEALAIDRYGPSEDDEVGHTPLDKSCSHTAGLAFYNWDARISAEALMLSRHVVESSGVGPRVRASLRGDTRYMNYGTLIQERMANQVRAVSFLDDVMMLTGPFLPRAAAVLDYTPYVRQMILADDAMEVEAQVEAQEMGENNDMRRRRRSQWRAEKYPRYLNVSVEGQAGSRNLAFSE